MDLTAPASRVWLNTVDLMLREVSISGDQPIAVEQLEGLVTTKYQTPVTVETPIVLVHPAVGGDLWTSVFTVGEFDDHLEESSRCRRRCRPGRPDHRSWPTAPRHLTGSVLTRDRAYPWSSQCWK
jgi:hypothetical protein